MKKNKWTNRIVGHGEEAPDQLLANPMNWRIHPKYQQEALTGVLNEVGWVQDVIVNQKTGHLIDGHLRVQLAMRNNEPTIPVVYVDLTLDEESLILASLDPIGAMAAADKEKLEELTYEVNQKSKEIEKIFTSIIGQKNREEQTDERIDLRPFKKTHILFSFPSEKLIEIQEYIEKIRAIEGIEYEQSSN